jgi:2-methylcitrate dehydratase PrpD
MDDELAAWMRLLLLDYAAVASAGADRDSASAARRAVALSSTPSSAAPSLVHGTGQYAAPEDAALVNGVSSHGLELDDTFEEASLHPGVVIFPALLALADAEGATADAVLRAAAIGYDVMCVVGTLVGAAESYGRGFHPTGISGAVGGAAAAAALLRLDEEQSLHAVALAANMAAGSLEFLSDGSWTKRLNAGHAAATAIRAARLAKAGFTGPETAIEGRDGFLTQYGQGAVEGRRLVLRFGESALATSIKFYPCCRYMHGTIDLLRDVHREYPGLTVDDVHSIETAVLRAGASLVSEPRERKLVVNTPVDAQFNMPFGAALALATGEATVADFDDAPKVAAALDGWIRKVECYTSDELEAAFPASWQAEVRVRLADGTVIERRESAFRGSPGERATIDQVVEKATNLLGESAASLAASIRLLDGAERMSGQIAFPVVGALIS